MRRRRRRPRPVLGLLLVAVPLLVIGPLIATSAAERADEHRAYAGGVTVAGTVSDVDVLVTHGRYGDSRSYIETVDFMAEGGQRFVVATSEDGDVPVGTTVTVSYRPGDPDHARWVQRSRLGAGVLAGAVTGGLGLLALVGAGAVAWSRRRRRAYA